MIFKKLAVGPLAANCYIVGSEATEEGMIIDPGAETGKVLRSVKELKLRIKYIVLTHRHPDHTGALKGVKQATDAEIAAYTDKTEFPQDPVILAFEPFYQSFPSPDRLLQDGDSIEVGDLRFLVLHTPGHSPDSICLLGHGILFSGDTLFNHSIGRYDISGGSYRQLMDSLHTRLMVLPDDTIVYTGHGPDTTIGAERRANPFLHG